jgi:hypothetical protein
MPGIYPEKIDCVAKLQKKGRSHCGATGGKAIINTYEVTT